MRKHERYQRLAAPVAIHNGDYDVYLGVRSARRPGPIPSRRRLRAHARRSPQDAPGRASLVLGWGGRVRYGEARHGRSWGRSRGPGMMRPPPPLVSRGRRGGGGAPHACPHPLPRAPSPLSPPSRFSPPKTPTPCFAIPKFWSPEKWRVPGSNHNRTRAAR